MQQQSPRRNWQSRAHRAAMRRVPSCRSPSVKVAAFVVADDLLRTSAVEHRQPCHLVLDRPHAGEEGVRIWRRCQLSTFSNNYLGVVIANGKPSCFAAKGPIWLDVNA